MNLWHLKYFLAAAKAGNLGDAAREYRVTHSTVSQAIRSLEATLGVQLMRHAKRRFELSDEGRLLVERGRDLLDGVERLHAEIGLAANEPTGTLTIAAPQSLVGESLAEPLAQFRKRYPKVRVRVLTGAAQQVKRQVAEGDCDVGMLLDDLALEGFSSDTIDRGRFVLIGNKTSSLARDGVLVTAAEKPEVLHLMKAFRARERTDLRVDMELLSWSLIKKLVSKGYGIGYVPSYVVAPELRKKTLREVTMPGKAYDYAIKSIWPKNRQLPRNATLFLDLVRKTKS